ncbi:sn-glycerol-3-phosphate transporter [Coralloluteibacterium thermophilus]|uniref:Sn-glycerol-3-phosphate transporter n=1 Tax=Coralloluteibacterium thermophilum TaxID=2707049 RepID=A0ABV9NQ27_9GAMM
MSVGTHVHHYRSDPDHHERPGLLALDYSPAGSEWFVGGATFRNSFRQRSAYAYTGRRYAAQESPFYLQVTAGLLAGYRGEHRHKIPMNWLGVAPVVIPSVGVEVDRYRGELIVLGNSALMLGWGVDF